GGTCDADEAGWPALVRDRRPAPLIDGAQEKMRRAFDERAVVRIELGVRQRFEPVCQAAGAVAVLIRPVCFSVELAHCRLRRGLSDLRWEMQGSVHRQKQ